MAAAPPPPPPPKAHRDGVDAPVSLFLDTELGTRLALLVAPDTTIGGLKSQVDAEHAAAFPDLGPVAVKSFQVRRKGVLYHLSDSMTVTSAFTKIKGGCFLHVKMTEAVATRCFQDDGRRSCDSRLGINVEKRVQDLPALTSEIACDVLPQMLEGGGASAALNDVQAHDALPSSSQLNTEIMKNKAVGLAIDTEAGCDPVIEKAKSYSSQIQHVDQTEGSYISSTSMENVGKPNQSNISHSVEEIHARKENILHGDGDNEVGGGVSDDKEVSIQEQTLEEMHPKDKLFLDNLSQEKEHRKSRTDSFEMPAPDPPRITNESDVGDLNKSSRAPLEPGASYHREPLITSFRQEVQDTLHEDSTENPSTVGKKKKRKRHQLAPSKVHAQEASEPSAGVEELSKSTGDACNVELTGRDEFAVKSSGLTLSSSGLNDGNQGGKLVQLMSDAQASTDLISEQGKFDRALKGGRNPSIGDVINSAGEVVASEVGNPKGSITPWNGGEKHEQIKQHDERSHDEGVAEMSNMEKDGKSTDALVKRQTNDNTSQLKKRKKEKKSNSVDLASVDTTHEKEVHGYTENAARSAVSTEMEIVHDPFTQHISNNVHQGDSNIIENPNGDGKKKKRRRRHLESSKGVDPSQDLTKSSDFVTNESSMHFTDGAPLDAKQTTPGGATVIDHKELGENLAAKNVIDEVLADLRSKEISSKNLDEDMLTGETHLGSNKNALGLPESKAGKVCVSDALPPKYPAAVHSDSPASSPRLKMSKEEKLKVVSIMIDSSHHSSRVPEDANREINESDSLRFSDKTSDPKDILTGDAIAQADDEPKATKRRRKKVSLKQVPADNGKTLDDQVCQVDTLDLKGVNATQTNLSQGGSLVDTPLSAVGKVEQKGRPSKSRTVKVQDTNCSTPGLDSHLKDSHDEYVTDVIGTHNNESAAGTTTETPVIQKDAMALKSASPNSQKARKKSSNSELKSWDSALEHGPSADLGILRSDKSLVSPKNSADAAEPNYDSAVHPPSDAINFLDHFSSSKVNDPSVSVGHKQNNESETSREVKNKKKNKRKQGTSRIEPNDVLEPLLPTDKTSLTGHFGTSEAIIPSVAAENMNSKDENVKNGKEKKRKTKANSEMPVAEKENPNCDNQGIDIGTQESRLSVIQKGRMGQDNGKERSSSKVTQNDTIVQYKPKDASLEKKLHQNGIDDQNKLLADKDHVHISKEVRKTTSKIKPHAKSKHDESIMGRVTPNPKPVKNLVKDFSTSPLVSSDSTEATPQNANRYRVAIRKVPSKTYEQTSEKSRKENRKVGSGAIFNDANSEGSDDELDRKNGKAIMEASANNSATSGDSGISSAAYNESGISDDDGNVSLSQRSLKDGLDIGSILRGSSSYKKVRKKQSELLDDDTEVPDSQPADGLWD